MHVPGYVLTGGPGCLPFTVLITGFFFFIIPSLLGLCTVLFFTGGAGLSPSPFSFLKKSLWSFLWSAVASDRTGLVCCWSNLARNSLSYLICGGAISEEFSVLLVSVWSASSWSDNLMSFSRISIKRTLDSKTQRLFVWRLRVRNWERKRSLQMHHRNEGLKEEYQRVIGCING